MKKKLLVLLAVICLVALLVPMAVSADEVVDSGTCGDNVNWVLTSDGTLTISGTGDMDDYSSSGSPWYSYSSSIVTVVMDEGVTSIGDYAFEDCDSLTSVTIPDGVTSIGSYAFGDCASLTGVTIPDGVTSIASSTFSGCKSLTDITIPDGVASIGNYAFQNCGSLTSIVIPDGVTRIGYYTFYNCQSLVSVTIPNSVTNIDNCAFFWCTALTDVTIPNNLTTIGISAFAQCHSLTEVTIPDSVTSIDNGAFYGCRSLTGMWVDENNANYCSDEFGVLFTKDKTRLMQAPGAISGAYNIPDGVTSIDGNAFYSCRGLTSVTIPDGVTSIGGSAFYWSYCLTTIAFTGDAPTFGDYVFDGVTATVYYPADNTTWTEDVMQNCGGTLTWVAVTPAAITSQPTTQKVTAGSTATFAVEAVGIDLSYQWQTKTSSSGSWKDCTFDGSQTATMSVPATTARNGYYYRCVITDGNGESLTTDIVRLYVLGVKTQPATQKVKAGATAKFTVSATGSGKTYQWQTKTSSSGSWKNCTFTGSKTATMSVSATTARNGYYYRCKITDDAGNVVYTNTVRLYVLSIKTQPTTQKVKAGSTAKFTVSATGSGLTYQWQTKTSSSGSWKNCTFTGSKTATMSVSATTARNGYYYRCKITDSAGNVTYTNTVRLYVLGIKTQPTSKTVKSGNTAKFTVSATGSGLTYQWQTKTSSSGSWKNCTFTGSKTATMSVSATTARNGYYYRCKITDSAGNVVYTNTVKLTVK